MDRDKNSQEYTGRGEGMQGIDKAPGEEPSQSTEQFTSETQKAKKVDADLDNPNERAHKQDMNDE